MQMTDAFHLSSAIYTNQQLTVL